MLDGRVSKEALRLLRHPRSVSILLPAVVGGGGGACSQCFKSINHLMPLVTWRLNRLCRTQRA